MTSSSGASRRQVLAVAAAAATAPLIAGAPARAAESTAAEDLGPDGPRHLGHPRQRLQLGLLQGRRVRRQRAQRRRRRQGGHPGQPDPRRAQGQGDAGARRRRHHPGHPAGHLLRQAGADHQTGETHPMANAMNVIEVRRGRRWATTSSTTVCRCCAPGSASSASRRSRANAVNAATGRPAFLPYVIKKVALGGTTPRPQGRHPRPDQPGRGHLGQGQRRGQAGLRRHGRHRRQVGAGHAGAAAPTSSSSPPTAATAAPPATARELPNENPAALIAEQVPGHRRDPVRPRPQRGPAEVRHQHRHRRAGADLRAV